MGATTAISLAVDMMGKPPFVRRKGYLHWQTLLANVSVRWEKLLSQLHRMEAGHVQFGCKPVSCSASLSRQTRRFALPQDWPVPCERGLSCFCCHSADPWWSATGLGPGGVLCSTEGYFMLTPFRIATILLTVLD